AELERRLPGVVEGARGDHAHQYHALEAQAPVLDLADVLQLCRQAHDAAQGLPVGEVLLWHVLDTQLLGPQVVGAGVVDADVGAGVGEGAGGRRAHDPPRGPRPATGAPPLSPPPTPPAIAPRSPTPRPPPPPPPAPRRA